MLHIRLRVPDHCLDRVVSCLRDDRTTTNLMVVKDTYVQPQGSLVTADVAMEHASAVLSNLRDLDLHRDGSISLDVVETIMSGDADRAEREAPGDPDDSVVWELVEAKLLNDAGPSLNSAIFMLIAVLIASVGRILDETVLIVAAMVVGPDFAAVAGTAYGLARRRWNVLKVAVPALIIRFIGAGALASGIWAVAYRFGAYTQEQAGSGQLTDFIVRPDGWSFVIALMAGVVGVLSLTTSKSGPLVGVFISVTTVPAVGAFAICVASGLWSQAAASAMQLGINLLGILIAGVVTIVVQQVVWARIGRSLTLTPGNRF